MEKLENIKDIILKKELMTEEEMEQYQIQAGYNPLDNEGTIDSTSVFDNAIDYLDYTPYRLGGDGKLDDTYIFVKN